MSILQAVIISIVIFGTIIGIHEFGHFLAAKISGVWVQEFAIGFGPKLLSKKIGDTNYRLNLIPFGGYVKLFGERALQSSRETKRDFEALPDEEEDRIKELSEKYQLHNIEDEELLKTSLIKLEGVDEQTKDWLWINEMNSTERGANPRRYNNTKPLLKLLIVCSGVAMNFLLGAFLYMVFLMWVNNSVLLPRLSEYNFMRAETASLHTLALYPAYDESLKPLEGAVILKIAGEYIYSSESLFKILSNNIDRSVDVEIYKNGDIFSGNYTLARSGEHLSNLDPSLRGRIVISQVQEGLPAKKAGLEPLDIILEINGSEIFSADKFNEILTQNQGKDVMMKVLKINGDVSSISVKLEDPIDPNGPRLGAKYFINFENELGVYLLNYPMKSFLRNGFAHAINMIGYQYTAFKELIQRSIELKEPQVITDQVGGPLRIGAEIKGLIEFHNFKDILNLAGMVSLIVGVMNILPLPIVDGGFIWVILYETLTRKELSERAYKIYNIVGLVLVVLLMISITLKDIIYVFFD